MIAEDKLKMYYFYLDRYISIIKDNPSEEILQSMMGVVGEHDTADIVKGVVTNGKGSDVTIETTNTVDTKSGPITLTEGNRVEVKSTYVTIADGKKVRVQQVIDKRGQCEFVLLRDYRPEYKRNFLIPAAVFYSRAMFNDVGYTNAFKWDADYIPRGKYGPNTSLILEYEIVQNG